MWHIALRIIQIGSILSIFRVIRMLGVGFLVYVGVDYVMSNFVDLLEFAVSGVPNDILQILEMMGLSTGLTYLVTGFLTGAALKVVFNRSFFGLI